MSIPKDRAQDECHSLVALKVDSFDACMERIFGQDAIEQFASAPASQAFEGIAVEDSGKDANTNALACTQGECRSAPAPQAVENIGGDAKGISKNRLQDKYHGSNDLSHDIMM